MNKKVKYYKQEGKQFFASYHLSKLGVQEWNMLENWTEHIIYAGGIQSLDEELDRGSKSFF